MALAEGVATSKARDAFSEWAVMGAPRDDGSDTLLFLDRRESSNLRRIPPPQPGEPTLFDGQVALRRFDWPESFWERFEPAPFDHPNIQAALELLKAWPAIYAQCGRVLNGFEPVLIKGAPDDGSHQASNSHQPPGAVGGMWATVNTPVLLAQAIVHETAHNKLFSIDQHFESTGPLFANDPGELFDSPIRVDIPRPMSAVFHGVYAFTHVLALDRHWWRRGIAAEDALALLQRNALRMTKGVELIEKCAKLTPEGTQLVGAFLDWARREIEAAQDVATAHRGAGDGPLVLVGPQGGGKSTLAALYSKRTGKEVLSSSAIRWEVWWRTAEVQRKLLALFGSARAVEAMTRSRQYSKAELLRNWARSGHLSAAEVGVLKLKLCLYMLTERSDAVLVFDPEDCYFEHQVFIDKLAQLCAEARARVVLVRPVLDLDSTVAALRERLAAEGREADEAAIRGSLQNPAFRVLADYVMDTDGGSAGEWAERLLGLWPC